MSRRAATAAKTRRGLHTPARATVISVSTEPRRDLRHARPAGVAGQVGGVVARTPRGDDAVGAPPVAGGCRRGAGAACGDRELGAVQPADGQEGLGVLAHVGSSCPRSLESRPGAGAHRGSTGLPAVTWCPGGVVERARHRGTLLSRPLRRAEIILRQARYQRQGHRAAIPTPRTSPTQEVSRIG